MLHTAIVYHYSIKSKAWRRCLSTHALGISLEWRGYVPLFFRVWPSSTIYKNETVCYGKVIWHPWIGPGFGRSPVGCPAQSLLSSLPSQAEFHASLGYPLRGWNFTPPFPRHGRATNTRGGGWRRGSRRARTVASGARRRRVWSLRATTNGLKATLNGRS